MAFHHWFGSCFHFSPLIFTTVFRLLSLLIAFFYVTNVLCHDCFFAAFLSGTSFWCCCAVSATDLRKLFFSQAFLPYAPSPHLPQYRECYGFQRAFLISGVSYLTLFPDILHKLLLSRFPWEPAVLPWRLHGLPSRFET